jgi:hypothetical protein
MGDDSNLQEFDGAVKPQGNIDMENLFVSSGIATVLLDRGFIINCFPRPWQPS